MIEDDAKILAKVIIENWQDYDDGDYSPVGYRCYFCWNSTRKGYEHIKHDLNCPVLVAKDILVDNGKNT